MTTSDDIQRVDKLGGLTWLNRNRYARGTRLGHADICANIRTKDFSQFRKPPYSFRILAQIYTWARCCSF